MALTAWVGIALAALPPSAAPRLRPRPPVVVVDAGHGWSSLHRSYTGAYNRWADVHEDPLALDIARRLAGALSARGVEVHLTREGDQEPPDYNGDGEQTNRDRSYFALNLRRLRPQASQPGADLYVSIHLNASPDPSDRGTTVVYSEVGPAAEHVEESRRLAEAVYGQLTRVLPESAPPFAVNGLYMDRLALPHAVVEVVFLSNWADLQWILKAENRQTAAELVAEGIVEWWGSFPNPGAPPRPEGVPEAPRR
ncbi:N-acetylmuramoyl-L-alanine amidase family protein [Geochorda subterranea]|uniref:N-acetylmuramoyl-L-alanine amidase n=1 Tax=Geochorda subterranea TaxID=3109564 RepID=A0ABZ1BQA5_9FIRM|nr:N-acetylmuramoyl-L-alanine amidase [Limnochorda sp. LNt]WRP14813.1 N-acetylmuramoyl-L-alanine amidase [Limnochorda sp. LNt]